MEIRLTRAYISAQNVLNSLCRIIIYFHLNLVIAISCSVMRLSRVWNDTKLIFISCVLLVFFFLVYFVSFILCVAFRSHSQFLLGVYYSTWRERRERKKEAILYDFIRVNCYFAFSSQVVFGFGLNDQINGFNWLEHSHWAWKFIEDDGYLLKQ